MRTKDKNNYTINEDVFDFEDNTKKETVSAWKQVLIGTIAFLIIFFLFFYFFEGKPYKVVDQWSKNFCESSNPNDYYDIKQDLGTIIEKNGYNYSKICFIYYPATDYDSEEIVVFFKDSDEWYRFKDGMTFKWKLPENLRKKIRETN